MSNQVYTSIYKVKNVKELKDIEKWRNNTFDSPVKHGKNHDDEFSKLKKSEKNYSYTWEYIRKEKKLPFVVDGIDIPFIEASAEIEYAKKRIFDGKGHFLPKDERTNHDSIGVIFFELDGNIYVIIQESRKKQIDRVLDLIGLDNYCSSGWKLSKDFFNWLVYSYSELEGKISSKIKIASISGFTGNVFDNENIVSSKSMETIKLIATRAFISTGGILKEVSIILNDSDNCSICCKLDTECKAVISINDSEKITNTNGLDKTENLIMYVYTYLIPLLRNIFGKDKIKFRNQKKRFAKKIGIEVVNEIMKENEIKKSELN